MTAQSGPTPQPAPTPLPGPVDADVPLRVLYDEGCPFCRWTAESLRRWDRAGKLRLIPYDRTKEDPELAASVAGEHLGETVHVVDADGRMATGADAVLAVTALLPGGRLPVRLVRLSPPARWAVGLGYEALNRWRGVLADVFGLDGRRPNELRVP